MGAAGVAVGAAVGRSAGGGVSGARVESYGTGEASAVCRGSVGRGVSKAGPAHAVRVRSETARASPRILCAWCMFLRSPLALRRGGKGGRFCGGARQSV